jgi:hypothetical protein
METVGDVAGRSPDQVELDKLKLDKRGVPIVKPRGADERAVNPPREQR